MKVFDMPCFGPAGVNSKVDFLENSCLIFFIVGILFYIKGGDSSF